MSRVIYANTTSTPEQEALRAAHQVRLVEDSEEGFGVDALPQGIYGFTYSPALPNAPMFRTRRFRSFETHKRADGEILIVGFVSQAEALACNTSREELQLRLQPEPEPDADVMVMIPYSRIRHHQQYSVRTEHGLTLRIGPGIS